VAYRESFNHHVEIVLELLILLAQLLLGGCNVLACVEGGVDITEAQRTILLVVILLAIQNWQLLLILGLLCGLALALVGRFGYIAILSHDAVDV
jgi:hypothetical protein